MQTQSNTTSAPADLPALIGDLTAVLPGWDPARPTSELFNALKERLANQPTIRTRKSQGKSMARRKGQTPKIEIHGANYTFRARVDVEGQVKRPLRRIPISPADPTVPGYLNAFQRQRKAYKLMEALEGKNERVVEGEDGRVLTDNETAQGANIEPAKPPVPTFLEQSKVFMIEILEDDPAPSTQKNRRGYLNNWLLPLFGDLPIDQITNSKVKVLINWMKNGGPIPQIGRNNEKF